MNLLFALCLVSGITISDPVPPVVYPEAVYAMSDAEFASWAEAFNNRLLPPPEPRWIGNGIAIVERCSDAIIYMPRWENPDYNPAPRVIINPFCRPTR